MHLAANLDNWDPRIIDPIARSRHVITFDQRGVGASTGRVAPTIEEAADHAYEFLNALGLETIDIFSFSMGGFIAQDLIVKHPDLVRRLVLTGTGPRGGKDIDKVARPTYWDILRATLTRSDPKEFLFFNRNATGKAAGRAFVKRLEQRTVDRDEPVSITALRTQLKAIKKFGRSAPSDLSTFTQLTLVANGDADRMVPSVLSEDLHHRIHGSELIIYPDAGHGGDLPAPRRLRPDRRRVPHRLSRPHPTARPTDGTDDPAEPGRPVLRWRCISLKARQVAEGRDYRSPAARRPRRSASTSSGSSSTSGPRTRRLSSTPTSCRAALAVVAP